MNRIRGFEFISEDQFKLDFKDTSVKYEDLKLPKRATAKSAGYDVFAPFGFTLLPNQEIKLPTGIKSYMLDDEMSKAHPRSGHGFSYYIRLANTIGVIDADYYNNKKNEGHIWIKLRNEGKETMTVQKGEACCQLIFEKYLLADGDSFDGEERNGGFGSTTK